MERMVAAHNASSSIVLVKEKIDIIDQEVFNKYIMQNRSVSASSLVASYSHLITRSGSYAVKSIAPLSVIMPEKSVIEAI